MEGDDGHESLYSWAWLQARRKQSPYSFESVQNETSSSSTSADMFRRTYWGRDVASEPPMVNYTSVMESEEAVREWTSLIVSDPRGLGLSGF